MVVATKNVLHLDYSWPDAGDLSALLSRHSDFKLYCSNNVASS